ncbi:MAG: helix-turn-helix transcriptional regulator [Lachnospiraceae bacterium]|nr:helix-turn-helix transcriptional regulator [Lachnospiraceae bacterium]
MVKNNIEIDVKVKCKEKSTTQVKIAEQIETTKSYVNRVIKKPNGVINPTFVQIMEALGYDIEITYVKRDAEVNDNDRK